jgi:hypothetical protein
MFPESLAWSGILLLGIWHGMNPGMGWLFAVALGMQDRKRRAVWRALPPLALGHGIAIAGALLLAASIEVVIPLAALQWGVGLLLVVFGGSKLVRSRHPRYGGMRMSSRELTVWSALMASAHGAGLMVVPFVLGRVRQDASAGDHTGHLAAIASGPGPDAAIFATALHTGGYLLATCLLAFLVYERLGLSVLKRMWVNLDVVWAMTLVVTGVLTPLL